MKERKEKINFWMEIVKKCIALATGFVKLIHAGIDLLNHCGKM